MRYKNTKKIILAILKLLTLISLLVSRNDIFNLIAEPLTTIKYMVIGCLTLDSVNFLTESPSVKISLFFKTVFACILSTIFFHFVTIIFGAALVESVSETFHLSILLTVLTVVPCVLNLGVEDFPWLDSDYQDVALSVCTLAGTWFGAIPIPLDWDRPWQEWPITCVIGACCGHIIGLLYTIVTVNKNRDDKYKLG